MFKTIAIVLILVATVTLNAQTVKPIYVVHISLGNRQLADNVISEMLRPNPLFKNRPVVVLKPNLDLEDNPFAVSKWGPQTGLTREDNMIKHENTPIITEKMEKWFEDLEKRDIHPEVFIINGHHLVSMGFESDDTWETKFINQFGSTIELSKRNLYFPTIRRSRNYYPAVKRFFDGIKMVFIGGCEGLSNLEPKENGISGRALMPEEIKARYFGGQKKLMLGDVEKGTGLAGYKEALVRVYPGSFTDKEEEEICIDRINHLNCETFNVTRILPDSGLWDGSHAYNIPYQMKRLFPNAYGVFGFYTPSPLTPGPIWNYAFNESRHKLQMNNFFQVLLNNQTSTEMKKEIIQRLRISWTEATQKLNSRMVNGKRVNRVSGSITPAFPDLDQSGLFAYDVGAAHFAEAPAYAPYEVRTEVAPTTQAEIKTRVLQPISVDKIQKLEPIIPEKQIKAPALSQIKDKLIELNEGKEKKYNPTEKEDPLFNFIEEIEKKK